MSPEVESTKWWVVNECNITLGWITPLSWQQFFSALVKTKKDSDWSFSDETTFGDWQDEALKPQQSTCMAKLTRTHCEDGTGGSVNKDNITAVAVRSSFKQKKMPGIQAWNESVRKRSTEPRNGFYKPYCNQPQGGHFDVSASWFEQLHYGWS